MKKPASKKKARPSKARPELAQAKAIVRELKLQLREAERSVMRVRKGGKLYG